MDLQRTEPVLRQQIEKSFKDKNDSLETFYKLAINR